jgi:HSP20 family molecular chaperone IbpA
MKTQPVSQAASVKQVEVAGEQPTIADAESLLVREKEVYAAVARRAYQFFESRGYENGHDIEDWLRAESELLCPVPVEIKESNDHLTVLAGVGGFSAQEIEIGVEPQRLFISGKKKVAPEKSGKDAVYVEEKLDKIFRTIDLSAQVNPSKLAAKLEDQTLKITLPKAIIEKAAQPG